MGLVDFFKNVSPPVYQNGIDLVFCVIVLLIIIVLFVLFAIFFCGWAFRIEPFTKKVTFYDGFRIALGLGFMGFTMVTGQLALEITDLGLKLGIIGIELGVFAYGSERLFSVYSDVKSRP
jgi:uncharacterized membrane protein